VITPVSDDNDSGVSDDNDSGSNSDSRIARFYSLAVKVRP
jgi:hypothetical protein